QEGELQQEVLADEHVDARRRGGGLDGRQVEPPAGRQVAFELQADVVDMGGVYGCPGAPERRIGNTLWLDVGDDPGADRRARAPRGNRGGVRTRRPASADRLILGADPNSDLDQGTRGTDVDDIKWHQ